MGAWFSTTVEKESATALREIVHVAVTAAVTEARAIAVDDFKSALTDIALAYRRRLPADSPDVAVVNAFLECVIHAVPASALPAATPATATTTATAT